MLLTKNQPGVVEAPTWTYATDMLRLVLKGSVLVGDRSYHEGNLWPRRQE